MSNGIERRSDCGWFGGSNFWVIVIVIVLILCCCNRGIF
jgi:hypothetical protein